MANLFTDTFESYTTDTEPTGITKWDGAVPNTYLVKTTRPYTGSKGLLMTGGGNHHAGFYFTTPPSVGEYEYIGAFNADSASSDRFGLSFRMHDVSGTNKGYYVTIRSGNSLRLSGISGTTESVITTVAITAISLDTWYWIKVYVKGNVIKARYWADGSGEPATWTIDTTDSTYDNTKKGVGIYLYSGNVLNLYYVDQLIVENIDKDVSVTDTVTVSESVGVSVQAPAGAGTPLVSVSDTVTLSESISVSVQAATTRTISVSETLTLTESVNAMVSPPLVSITDTVTISESVTISITTALISVSDSIVVSEVVNPLLLSSISAIEYLLVSEGGQLVPNSGFETLGAGGADVFGSWTESVSGTSTITAETSTIFSGTNSAKITVDSSNSLVFLQSASNMTVKGGQEYVLSIRHRASVAGAQLEVGITDGGGTPKYLQSNGTWSTSVYRFAITSALTWGLYRLSFTTEVAQTTLRFQDIKRSGSSSQANNVFYIDDVEIYSFNVPKVISNIGVSDTVTITEAVTLNKATREISVSDTVTVSESVSGLPYDSNARPMVADSVSITESVSLSVGTPAVGVTETITITESVSGYFVSEITVEELVQVDDLLIDSNLGLNVMVSESVAISESVERASHIERYIPGIHTIDRGLIGFRLDTDAPKFTTERK